MTGNIVYPLEYDILVSMDRVYCEEMNKELHARREKQRERAEREAEVKRK